MLDRATWANLFPSARAEYLDALAAGGATLQRFGITSPNRLHFFLAQVGHESGGLTHLEERLGYRAERLMQVWPSRFPTLASAQLFAMAPEKLANQVYANRMGNGAPASGDGWRYRGRGLIQITGRDGYRQVGAQAGIDLEAEPDRALRPADLLAVALGFWKWKSLNALCDAGDFTGLTRKINGGTVGMSDRLAWLDKVRRTLAAVPATAAGQHSPAEIRAIQLALQARHFAVGAADGLLGPRTAAAIRQYRLNNGLGDGLIDDRLLELLEVHDAVA